jgi:hypothetical protein
MNEARSRSYPQRRVLDLHGGEQTVQRAFARVAQDARAISAGAVSASVSTA